MDKFDIVIPIALSIFGVIVGTTLSPPINGDHIKVAQKICGDRDIEWLNSSIVKCKDGGKYENYYENSKSP